MKTSIDNGRTREQRISELIGAHRAARRLAIENADNDLQQLVSCLSRNAGQLFDLSERLINMTKQNFVSLKLISRPSSVSSLTYLSVSVWSVRKFRRVTIGNISDDICANLMSWLKKNGLTESLSMQTLKVLGQVSEAANKYQHSVLRLIEIIESAGVRFSPSYNNGSYGEVAQHVKSVMPQVSTFFHYTLADMEAIERVIDPLMKEINSVLPKRYHSLLISWIYPAKVSQYQPSPKDIQWRFIASTNKTINGDRYTRSISKIAGVQLRSSERSHVTWDVINRCRLVRYRKYILSKQNQLSPYISQWREAYDQLERTFKLITQMKTQGATYG